MGQGENLDIDYILVRDDDIPILVADNVCDVGIVGRNVLVERELELQFSNGDTKQFEILKDLGFGGCRLSLAVPNVMNYQGITDINGLKVATSYPYILKNFLLQNKVDAEIINLSGSVEIAPRLKVADLICDLIATGETLKANNLKEVCEILSSEAVLFKANNVLNPQKQIILDMLLQRLHAVLAVKESKYIMFHLPKEKLACLHKILPGVDSPSILQLDNEEQKVAVHIVSQELVFWETLESLKMIGASSILVLPIEKMLR